jgi:hypothetical protein
MRRSLKPLLTAGITTLLLAACSDVTSAPTTPAPGTFAKGAAGGGGGGTGGGGTKTFSATGEWFGFLTASTPGEASIDLLLTQTGTDVTGTETSTLYNQGNIVQTSDVTGTADGTTVTLHFTCPSTGRACSVTSNYIQERGLGLLALVTDDATGFGVGQFNVVRR